MAKSALNKTHSLTDSLNSAGNLENECEDLLDYDGCNNTHNESRHHSDESTLNPEVYLSLVWHSGDLGIAYYDVSSLQIHVMADTPENDGFSLVKQILRELQPKTIVLSSLLDSALLDCIKKQITDESPMSERPNGCKLEFLPNSDFSYEVSKQRILSTHLPSVPKHFSYEERKLYYASLLGLDRTCMIRSLGGLLKYLDKMRVGVELEDTTTHVPVLGFRVFTLESQIHIDMRTYIALNIFRTELHPSVYKFGTYSSKEGLSLFGILNRCKSSIGSRMLRQWFLRPLRNASVLRQRYDAISFFLKPCNMEAVSCLQGCLKHIKYIPRILLRMSKAQATISDWIALSKTLYHAVYIGETCRTLTQSVEIFRKIGIAFTDDLHRCYNLLCKTIDFEASKQNKRFVVQANVDDKLDAKKCTFNGLPDLMNRVAREELKALREDIKACVVSYLPQIGYLLVIDLPEGQSETDDHTIDGLEFKFVSDNQLFYKSPRTLELDRLLGDTQLEILDMEVTIMHHLQDTILEKTQLMLDVMEMAAELDCLMALAASANEFGYSRPTLIEETVLDIKSGRHPLQELCCGPYVPNHTTMGGQHTKMKLLTGPNACGKSVYLKQVGLIVFMAHIGSYVPSEQASIGPVDKIFSCIKSLESISGGLSTFMQDNIQVSEALRLATSNSLVLVDEFGKGTESTDGLALLTAVIKFWIAKGSACPMVLISTHFHSIIQQKLLSPSTQLQFLTFDTVMNGDELVFLYQLKEGHTSSSYACNIASQVGLPPAIIKRGREVADLLAQNKSVNHLRDSGSDLQNERYERIVSAFLRLNLDTDDLHAFLKGYVLPLCAHSQQKPKTSVNSSSVHCVPEIPAVNDNNAQNIPRAVINKEGESSVRNVGKQRDEAVSTELHVEKNTYMSSIDSSLTREKIDGHCKDQGLAKNQESRDKTVLISDNIDTVNLTNQHNSNVSSSFWKKPTSTLADQFIKTPLVDKSERNVCEQSLDKCNLNKLGKNLTNAVQDQSTLKTSEKQQHRDPETEKPQKRKADMRFLFSSLPKQTKCFITSSLPAEKQASEAIRGTARREDRKTTSSSSTISPASETYSGVHEKSLTTHLSSTEESQKTEVSLQKKVVSSRTSWKQGSEEQTCDNGTTDSPSSLMEQAKMNMMKPSFTELSTTS